MPIDGGGGGEVYNVMNISVVITLDIVCYAESIILQEGSYV